jgi:ADP-heptose:LPS heptosyltransferase
MAKPPIKIALLNPGAGLGDHVLCFPALHLIQASCPETQIDPVANRDTAAIQQLLPPSLKFLPLEIKNPLAAVLDLAWHLLKIVMKRSFTWEIPWLYRFCSGFAGFRFVEVIPPAHLENVS